MAREKGTPTWIEVVEICKKPLVSLAWCGHAKNTLLIIMRPIENQYHCKADEYTVSLFLKSFVDIKAFCGVISGLICYKSNTLYWKIASLPRAKPCDSKSVHSHTAVQGVLQGNHPAILQDYRIYLEDSLQEHWMPTIRGCTFVGRSVKKW